MSIERLVRDNIKSLKPYSSAREEFKEYSSDFIFLDANENPYHTDVNRYPDPQQLLLKRKLSKIKKVTTEQLLLGNGSDEVLDLIFRVFCEPNKDAVITLPPTYGMYKVLAKTNAIAVKEVALNSDFQPDVDAILKSTNSTTKLLFLCSPNNPTANSLNSYFVEELLNRFTGIVVIDEAYVDFSNKESWLSRLDEFPNLIVTQTLSKAYGMAGIRLGICYASKEIIAFLNKIKPPYNINTLTQLKAIKLLDNTDEINLNIKRIIDGKKQLMKALLTIKFIEKVFPSDANFILVKVDNANKRYQQLIENGIVIRNRTSQIGCDNCLRITIGNSNENENLIMTLKKIDQ